MKNLFSSILVMSFLFSATAYAENITIKCIDEKRSTEENREVSVILNFDEGGDWIIFNGRSKEFSGREDNGLGMEATSIEITRDKISYFNSVESMNTHMQIIINRFDGSMYQYGKLKGEKYDYFYMCEKTERKF
jgi:hypothetical protein